MKRVIVLLSIIMIFLKIQQWAIMKNYFMILKLKIFLERIKLSKNLNIKVVLMVNTASYCGLQNNMQNYKKLWDKYKNQ